MRIARRYLASEIYRNTALVLIALLGLFSFFALIDELDRLGDGLSIWNLFYLELLELPTRLYDLLPIGLLVGAVLGLAGLAQRNELVILRVSGVSGLQLLAMLWMSTVPLMVGAFVLSEHLTPMAELRHNEARLELLGRAGGGRLSSGYWFKENTPNDGTRIINIHTVQTGGQVQQVTVLELNKQRQLERRLRAPLGKFHADGLILQDVVVMTIQPHAEAALANAQAPAEPLVTRNVLPEVDIATSLTSHRLTARIVTPERMAIPDLWDYIQYLDANQLQNDRQMVALWRKFAYPFSLLVMITIAAPISFLQTRRGGVGSKVFVGILLGVGFFMANQMALNIGTLSKWPPWLTALGPNCIALALALIALITIERQFRRRPSTIGALT